MTGPTLLCPVRLEHGRPVPLTGQERDLDVKAISFDGPSAPSDRPAPVFHGVIWPPVNGIGDSVRIQ
jgi:hypothetical protein